MKTKIFLLIFSAVVSITNVHSQNDTAIRHLEFMGVPITGKVSDFSRKLQTKGFERMSKDNDGFLTGQFTGKESVIMMLETPKSKQVYTISVFLKDEFKTWETLKDEYNKYKTKLTKKYGIPDSRELFEDPYYEGDGYEMQALRMGKCLYMSKFETLAGDIILAMAEQKIVILYQDKRGCIINEAEENDRDLDEL